MTSILMIEDSEDFAAALKSALLSEDDLAIVQHCNCVDSAKQFFASGKLSECDCVLLDLQLPHSPGDEHADSLAGLELLKQIRQIYRFYGVVIVLTNSQSPADGKRALEAGCDGYLCKQTKVSQLKELVDELKMAIRGDVILVATKMRHVFMREEISAKEARLLDLLLIGKSWAYIARELSYSTPKAAANVGDRIFDKLFTPDDQDKLATTGMKKRHLAMEIWNHRSSLGHKSENQ